VRQTVVLGVVPGAALATAQITAQLLRGMTWRSWSRTRGYVCCAPPPSADTHTLTAWLRTREHPCKLRWVRLVIELMAATPDPVIWLHPFKEMLDSLGSFARVASSASFTPCDPFRSRNVKPGNLSRVTWSSSRHNLLLAEARPCLLQRLAATRQYGLSWTTLEDVISFQSLHTWCTRVQ
jgi:hypothetical protein